MFPYAGFPLFFEYNSGVFVLVADLGLLGLKVNAHTALTLEISNTGFTRCLDLGSVNAVSTLIITVNIVIAYRGA